MAGFDDVDGGEAGASLSLADALPRYLGYLAQHRVEHRYLRWADRKGREALDPGGSQNDVQVLGAFCNRQTRTGRGLTLSLAVS